MNDSSHLRYVPASFAWLSLMSLACGASSVVIPYFQRATHSAAPLIAAREAALLINNNQNLRVNVTFQYHNYTSQEELLRMATPLFKNESSPVGIIGCYATNDTTSLYPLTRAYMVPMISFTSSGSALLPYLVPGGVRLTYTPSASC